jgi:RimJ/RimL family protein N-acetyltransferase
VLAQRDLPRSRYFLVIELRANAVLLENAGLEWSGADGESREGRLGYFLEPRFWDCGYATEAAALVLDLAFGKLDARVMRASCDERNSASERAMQRCGMQREPSGEALSRRAYRISREEWSAR